MRRHTIPDAYLDMTLRDVAHLAPEHRFEPGEACPTAAIVAGLDALEKHVRADVDAALDGDSEWLASAFEGLTSEAPAPNDDGEEDESDDEGEAPHAA